MAEVKHSTQESSPPTDMKARAAVTEAEAAAATSEEEKPTKGAVLGKGSKGNDEELQAENAAGAAEAKEENKQPGKGKSQHKEENPLQLQLPNRVIVARNHPLSYYVDRARRILRMEDTLTVSGRGNTISMACTLVEVLKRQKIAQIAKISTGMNVEPFFTAQGDPRWSPPISMITFHLIRGEFAEYVADYHQRKVIEIFEKTDDEHSGFLSFEEIEKFKFPTAFKANEEQTAQASAFLESKEEKRLNLPDFIRYASVCIHPLLKDRVFKEVLRKEFDISTNDRSDESHNNNNQMDH